MPRISYGLVSTLNQDHGTLKARLKAVGCRVIRAEKAGGTGHDGRDELSSTLAGMGRTSGREARSGGPLARDVLDSKPGSRRQTSPNIYVGVYSQYEVLFSTNRAKISTSALERGSGAKRNDGWRNQTSIPAQTGGAAG
jgi:hypothetical protein